MPDKKVSASYVGYRKPELVFLEQGLSYTNKYYIFFGLHYKEGKPCYDVGCSSAVTGEIVRRHYNESNNISPEASARTYWEEFKEVMQRRPEHEDEQTLLESVNEWLDINRA